VRDVTVAVVPFLYCVFLLFSVLLVGCNIV